MLTDDEFHEKISTLVGCGPDTMEATLARNRSRHQGLVDRVLQRRNELKAQRDHELPVPDGVSEQEFFGEHFRKACDLLGTTLRDVCKYERTKTEYDRMRTLLRDERITKAEYDVKIEALFGVPEMKADEVLRTLQKSQLTRVQQLVAAAQHIREQEVEERQTAEYARLKHQQYVQKLQTQVTQRIAKERLRSDNAVARQRAALEKVLIQRGVQETVGRAEKVAYFLRTPSLRKKAPPDIKNAGLLPKTTAGEERKKLWLMDRRSKAMAKTRSSAAVNMGQTGADSVRAGRPLTASEKRELMMEERAAEMKEKEAKKLHGSEMARKEKEAELRKKMYNQSLKRSERENARKMMMQAQSKNEEHMRNKLKQDEMRLAALKEIQEQERKAIAAIQKQARDEEARLKAMMSKAESDFEFNPGAGLAKIGIDMNKIQQHVKVRTTKLLSKSEAITTPTVDVPVPRSRPPSAISPQNRKQTMSGRSRPTSAPPSGPVGHDQSHVEPRPATAIARSGRPGTAHSKRSRPGTASSSRLRDMPEDGIPDDLSDIGIDDDPDSLRMASLETLRVELGKNLYQIVVEEQESEKERLRMLAAVHPNKKAHLNRLFEQEREEASQRIMRVAAENEMVILQEMALMSEAEEAFEFAGGDQ